MPNRYQFWRTNIAHKGRRGGKEKKRKTKTNPHTKKNPKAVRKMSEIKNLHLWTLKF